MITFKTNWRLNGKKLRMTKSHNIFIFTDYSFLVYQIMLGNGSNLMN